MMTGEQIMALPKKKANRAEVDAMYYMAAYAKKMGDIQGDIEKRARLIPGGVARAEVDHQQGQQPGKGHDGYL